MFKSVLTHHQINWQKYRDICINDEKAMAGINTGVMEKLQPKYVQRFTTVHRQALSN